MSTSSIEWTDETWNPTTGCDRVSPGCDNCYALTMSARLKAMGQAKYQTDGRPETSGPGFGVQVHPDTLAQPLRWRKPRRVFVNSMSDLFHPQVPDEFIAQVWGVMLLSAHKHTFQILTKRPKRMASLLKNRHFYDLATEAANEWEGIHTGHGDYDAGYSINFGLDDGIGIPQPIPGVWLGTSVEDQKRADERIPYLLATPAAVRFLSCEPLLGPVDLALSGVIQYWPPSEGWRDLDGHWVDGHGECYDYNGIDWVIIGGESGPGARPMDLAWARSIVGQCKAAGVATFVKQLGSRPYVGKQTVLHLRDRKGGDLAQWPLDLRVREFPEVVPA